MPNEQPCPKDSPLMIEWEKYRQTEDFKNSFKWAADVLHRTGSMWAAFAAGALAMKPDASASPEPAAESAWRTIESAPAGVEVLVCGIGSAGYYVALAKKIDGHWMIFCSEDDAFTLLSSGHSHWQPLPAPSALSNKG